MKSGPREIRQSFRRTHLCVIAFLIAWVSPPNLFAAGGDLDTTFEPGMGANGDVRAIAVQPDGKIIIGGAFTSYNQAPGILQLRIARINPNGTRDTSFIAGGGGMDNTVYALALQSDGKILVGGAFAKGIARLNTNGSVDSTFNPSPAVGAVGGDVRGIAIQADNKIIIVGAFTSYNGTGSNRIARLNLDGSLDTTFVPGTGASGSVFAVTGQSDGKVIIAGAFSSYNNTGRVRIARLNSNGSLDTSFVPGAGADFNVFAVAVQSDGRIIIGGLFSNYNTVPRSGIARINTNGSLDTTFDPGSGASSVHSVAVQSDGKVIIGSSFPSYNGVPRSGIARTNTNGSLDTTFDPGTGVNAASFVYAIGVQPDGKIVIGGTFTTYNGVTRNRIARLLPAPGALSFSSSTNSVNEGAGNAALTLTRTGGTDNSVTAQVTITHGTVDAADYIFAPGALDTTFEVGTGVAQRSVFAVAQQPDGKVLIGGDLLVYNGVSRMGMARLNPDGSLDTMFNASGGSGGLNLSVNAIALQPDGKILVGGEFTTYNGFSRNRIARLNANGSLDMTFDPGTGFDDSVRAIALQADGKILVGGDFLFFRDVIRLTIARLNADGSLDTTFQAGEGPNNFVRAIAIQTDGKILIAGDFFEYSNVDRNRIARINLDGSLDTTFDPGSGANSGANDGDAYAVAVQADGKIIVGGEFITFNGTARNRIAGLNANGSLDMSFDPGTGANQSLRAIRVQPDGKVIIAGFFTTYNDVARSRLARLNANGSLDTTFDHTSGVGGSVRAMALQADGKVVLGGAFSTYDNVSRNSIARVNGDLFVNWPAGDSMDKSIQLPIVDDAAPEGDETLTLNLTNLTGGATTGANSTQTLTIIDNDAAPTPTPTATPGPTATPTVTPEPTSTPTATPTPMPTPSPPPSVLGNISTRLRVETGDNALIGGFIVTGTQSKKVIIRAIGPSLSFADRLANPTLELRDSAGTLLQFNNDWVDSPDKQQIIDSTIAPTNDLESAIVAILPANGAGYTAIVRGVNDGTGIGLVEAYDLDLSVNSELANISTRGFVQTDDNVLIAGTIVLGEASQKVIVRAIGPSLSFPGVLEDPILELRDANGGLVRGNDNWRTGGQEAEIIATTIPPTNDLESAIVATLPANGASYTAIVRGVNNTTGIAVVEVYALN